MKYQSLLAILFLGILTSCRTSYSGSSTGAMFYVPGSASHSDTDSLILEEINPYQTKLNAEMNQVLANATVVLEKGQPESRLGNFVADACFKMAISRYQPADNRGIDFCILNNGGLRSSLPAGVITRKNVYELMPFENELVVLTLPGNSIMKILNYISEKGGVPVSNLRLQISGSSFSKAVIGDKNFDPASSYKLLTSDYLANGGDGMAMLNERINLERVNIKVRDAIIEYLVALDKNHESVNTELDGRISR